MPNQSLQEKASQLFDAYSGDAVAPLRNCTDDTSPEAAYAIQQINHERWLKEGRKVIGRKIGLTSKAVQAQLGVDQPDYGMVYADTCFCSGEVLSVDLFQQPKVEAEIAFVLKDDLTNPDLTIIDVINAVDYAVAALEIVGSRVKNWDITLFDTIADNASYGGIVMGTSPKSLSEINLETCSMKLANRGEVVSEGMGKACMGNPLLAAMWLAKTMIKTEQPLKAGDVVLSGALGPMVPVVSGDSFTAEIQGLGQASIHFS